MSGKDPYIDRRFNSIMTDMLEHASARETKRILVLEQQLSPALCSAPKPSKSHNTGRILIGGWLATVAALSGLTIVSKFTVSDDIQRARGLYHQSLRAGFEPHSRQLDHISKELNFTQNYGRCALTVTAARLPLADAPDGSALTTSFTVNQPNSGYPAAVVRDYGQLATSVFRAECKPT